MSMNGRKPENLQVGRLEIANKKKKKKAQRTGKKNRKKNQNWGVETRDHESNAKRPWGGEVDGYHRLLER
jgi:hypothetical protein